jgi:transposase-like protein
MVSWGVVHLIRAAMRFVSYTDRKKVAAALKPIYTAPTADAAETELRAFADSELGRRNPATVATWENTWTRFIPFLAFPPEVRKIIYTTNAIESLNYQLRKIIKNRGHFPCTTPSSNCSGWPSATSKTNAPGNAPKNEAPPATNAKPPAGSSKAPS